MRKTEISPESTNPGKSWVAMVGVNLVGVFLSLYLAWTHILVKYTNELAGGLCNLSSKINCNIAAGSRYAEAGGVPNAVIALGFYAAVLLVLFRGRKENDEWIGPLLVLGFGLASVYSVFLGGVLAFVLETLCPACVGLYVVNLVGLVLSRQVSGRGYLASLGHFGRHVVQMGGSTTLFSFVMTMVVVAGAGWWGSGEIGKSIQPDNVELTAQAQAWVLETYSGTEVISEEVFKGLQVGPRKGKESAPVAVVEISDFQCPFCSKVAPHMKRLAEEFPEDVKIHFVHNPLDHHCNSRIKKKFHPQACRAAYAAACAENEGKFWPMHDKLFENQRRLAEKSLIKYATGLGMEEGAFRACLKDPRTHAKIKDHLRGARKAKARGTPTLFVNGRKIKGAVSYAKLKAAVEYELEQLDRR